MKNKEDLETFVIIDANGFVHSSFNGYSPCLDKKGVDQKVLHGLMNTLVDLSYKIDKIDYLYMIFDPSDGSLFRKSVFPAYKANRPPTDPEMTKQKEVAIKILADHIGIPIVTHSGYEADDIIGSMVYSVKDNYNVIVVSPDKDLAQLVQENVTLMRRFRNKTERGYKMMNVDTVYENFGVYPHQIPDWLCLMGDAADNLPGLDKIGEKRAADILKSYVSLEHLLAIHHQLDNEKLKIQISEAKDILPIVKQLATIKCDLPLEDKIQASLEKAISIRSHPLYEKKLHLLRDYFNLSPYVLDMFIPRSSSPRP